MKKTLALLMSVMMLCTAAFALAEDTITIDITFEGEYYQLAGYNAEIMLPSDWVEFETEDAFFAAGLEDDSQQMAIYVAEDTGDYTLESLAEEMAADENYVNVAYVTINGIPFAIYEMADGSAFGAFAFTADDAHLIELMFAPNDEAMSDLATQILASFRIVEE